MARRKSRKTYSKKSSTMDRILKTLIPVGVAMAYGAARKPLADKLPDVKGMENYSDEAILGGAALLADVFVPNKYVKMAVRPIQSVEFARVGEKMRMKVPLSSGSGSGTGSSSGTTLY